MSNENAVAVNPLLTREVRPILSWNEFLGYWQEAATYEEMLGLLHIGLILAFESGHNHVDRILFYFGIADGWKDERLLQVPADKRKEYKIALPRGREELKKRPSEFRQMLAQKAFDMLCLNFFKEESDKSGARFSTKSGRWITSERLLPAVRHFFRVEEGKLEERSENRNLHYWSEQRTHNEEHAITFLLKLAEYIWEWEEKEFTEWSPNETEKNQAAEVRFRLNSAKPWMIEVLACLKRTDVLQKWLLELDGPCLAKLEEIALRNELRWGYNPVAKDRSVTTIDEACYVGSSAGWLIKKYEIVCREHVRLTAIQEAERARDKAVREVEELTRQK